jgi:hypothetical protein
MAGLIMNNMRAISIYFLQTLLFIMMSCAVNAVEMTQEKIQLGVDIDALGMDVAKLESEAVTPKASSVGIFVSLVQNVEYIPQTITLSVDGSQLGTHTYTAAEIASLRLGALHTLWQGQLALGAHKLEALLTGLDRKNKPITHTANLSFEKATNQRSFELKITAIEEGEVAVFSVKDWGDK